MTASTELAAAPREVLGKANRRLAAENRIPAVLYGPGRDAQPISIDRHDYELFTAHHAAGSTIVQLVVEGHKKAVNAMIREVQRSPVKGTIQHIDFVEVAMDKPVHATITLHLINDPVGVRAGGVMTINLHEISIEAKPADLPALLECDVAGLEIGDSLHAGEVELPSGVTLLDDPDTIVVSVQAPRVEVEEVVEEEAAEPELIGAKGEDESGE